MHQICKINYPNLVGILQTVVATNKTELKCYPFLAKAYYGWPKIYYSTKNV